MSDHGNDASATGETLAFPIDSAVIGTVRWSHLSLHRMVRHSQSH